MTNFFNKNDLVRDWIPPMSNDKELLKLRVDFFKNYDNKTLKYINLEYHEFITSVEKAIKENDSLILNGLEFFPYKDIIIGCHHFVDELITKYGLNNIQLFHGGYDYYKKLDPNIQFTTLDTLQPKKPLILEYPFPKYLDEHPEYKDIIKKCNNIDIDVYLDCAWLPVSFDLNLNLNEPCIKGMAMSLSKCYGLHWNRVGVRWLKNKTIDSISLQNENRMISFSNIMIGKYYLDRLPLNFLIKKYQKMYYQICEQLSLKSGKVILGAHSFDYKHKYGLKDLFLTKN